MKRKIIAVLLVVLSFTLLTACGKKDDDAIRNYCIEFASKYEVIKSNDDGSIQVSIKAPDFSRVMNAMAEESPNKEITLKRIKKTVKEHSDYEKTYELEVDSEDDELIENAFINKITDEMLITAITNVDLETENGSAE